MAWVSAYSLKMTSTVRRQLAENLPEAIAFAAFEFMSGPLLENPKRVGKQLVPPMDDRWSARRGTYRILYRIDEDSREVTVVAVAPRSDAYRTP